MVERRKPIFVVPLELGAIASGNEGAGTPAKHLNRRNSVGLVWRTTSGANAWARGQFTEPQLIDFCALLATNAATGTKVRLRLGATQAEVDGTAPYDSGPQSIMLPDQIAGPANSHLELDEPQQATWWRIDVMGHTGPFQAAILVLGEKIEPSHFYNFDPEFSVQDLGTLQLSRWGVFDEAPGRVLQTVDFTLGWQSEDAFETKWRPAMKQLGERGVIYCCFDPAPNVYRNGRTFLGPMRKAPAAKGTRKPKTYTQDFSLLSILP